VARPFQTLRAVPKGVWTLGVVSLFMDMSSEMVHALLPIFLMGTLGASAAFVGLVEGIAEATASITKVFSGWLSDRLGHRKWLAVAGYAMAAITKPLFPLATSPMAILVARFVERIGKGVRGAPRDALVADLTQEGNRGAAYGLRQSLDTVGAFVGPLIAIGLMIVLAGDIRAVFAWAIVPAGIAVLLLIFGIKEPEAASGANESDKTGTPPIEWASLKTLSRAFWGVGALGGLVTLARFSDAFLVLRAQNVGLPIALVPAIMVVMNVIYSLIAAPAGAYSDKVGPERLLLGGMIAMIAADLVLALWPTVPGAFVGVMLWGLHMGLSQGILLTMVAATAPEALRATAFGLFNLVSGVLLLIASVLAGQLWEHIDPGAPFLAGAAFAGLAVVWLSVKLSMRPNRAQA
jgi:MFS family permease